MNCFKPDSKCYGPNEKKCLYFVYKCILIDKLGKWFQLKIGGKLVAPIGTGKIQKMTLVQRNSEKKFSRSEYGNFSFVPMLTERTE